MRKRVSMCQDLCQEMGTQRDDNAVLPRSSVNKSTCLLRQDIIHIHSFTHSFIGQTVEGSSDQHYAGHWMWCVLELTLMRPWGSEWEEGGSGESAEGVRVVGGGHWIEPSAWGWQSEGGDLNSWWVRKRSWTDPRWVSQSRDCSDATKALGRVLPVVQNIAGLELLWV